MTKLTKEKTHLYVTEDGTTFFGIPRNAYFYVPRPELSAWVEGKHDLDRSNYPWDQFAPGEHFSPGGNRPALAFQTERPLRHAVRGEAKKEKYASIGQIGDNGETPFEGDIRFELTGADEDTYTKNASGHVWLAPGTIGPTTDTFFLAVRLSEELVAGIYRELVARPQAMLSVRLSFAYYQHEMDARHVGGPILVERDAQIPIIEASVSVVDRPLDWAESEDAKEPSREAAPVSPIVVQPALAPLLTRLNWAIGLLVLLILVLLVKR